MTSTSPTSLLLTGQLPFILIVAASMALPISFLLLWLYKRAVIRGMSRSSTSSSAPTFIVDNSAVDSVTKDTGSLTLCLVDTTSPVILSPDAKYLLRQARLAPWRAAMMYLAAGLLFATVMTFSFLRAGGMEFLPLRFLLLLLVHLWPLLLTLYLVVPVQRRNMLLLTTLYGSAYLLITAITLIRSPEVSVWQLTSLWAAANLPPTLLLAVFLIRRVRAVGPLVVTFLLFAITGAVVLLSLLEHNEQLLQTIAGAFFSLGLKAEAVFILLQLIGFILLGSIGWIALQWLRKRYLAKKANDQSLILDALWLFFGICYSVGLSFEGSQWIAAGFVAFAVYKTVVHLGLPLLRPQEAHDNVRLLVLRVFALGKRSETLFEAISRSWRYLGTVQLISGPDLATTTVEPHEFLDFITGRLDQQFIDGWESLQEQVNRIDTSPDFDGRYRVHDFFCYDDTWQMTLQQLMLQCDAVLMDLRGFTSERAGCVYELETLINSGQLDRVVLVIDSSTDHSHLETTLHHAWQHRTLSTNPHQHNKDRIRIIHLGKPNDNNTFLLLSQLCMAASGNRPPPPPSAEQGSQLTGEWR